MTSSDNRERLTIAMEVLKEFIREPADFLGDIRGHCECLADDHGQTIAITKGFFEKGGASYYQQDDYHKNSKKVHGFLAHDGFREHEGVRYTYYTGSRLYLTGDGWVRIKRYGRKDNTKIHDLGFWTSSSVEDSSGKSGHITPMTDREVAQLYGIASIATNLFYCLQDALDGTIRDEELKMELINNEEKDK